MRPMQLAGMVPEELAALVRASGVAIREGEARRVLAHAIAHGRGGFPVTRPVPRTVEEAIARLTARDRPEMIERAVDPADGFVKYLFRFADGAVAEAVRIPLEVRGRFTLCLSSQAGCAMGCTFCATGRLGLIRNLEPWEIVAQFLAVREEAPGTITGALFQGQGEPLHNYDAVMSAAKILSHPCGGRIPAKAITISTVGLVPAILRYARERQPYRLIVSLTSALDERRRTLLPVASAWPVAEVAAAVRAYQRARGGRATIAWVMLGGINTGPDEVEALRSLFEGVPLRISLIDVNIDVNEADGGAFRPPTESELAAFRDELRTLGVPIVRRYSGGAGKHAACGMLAARRNASSRQETDQPLRAG